MPGGAGARSPSADPESRLATVAEQLRRLRDAQSVHARASGYIGIPAICTTCWYTLSGLAGSFSCAQRVRSDGSPTVVHCSARTRPQRHADRASAGRGHQEAGHAPATARSGDASERPPYLRGSRVDAPRTAAPSPRSPPGCRVRGSASNAEDAGEAFGPLSPAGLPARTGALPRQTGRAEPVHSVRLRVSVDNAAGTGGPQRIWQTRAAPSA